MAFATVEDWAARPGNVSPTDPSEVYALEQRIGRADRKVRTLTRSARYRHDAFGTPIDSTVADVLRESVLDQMLYSDQTDPDGLGLGSEAVTVGPVSLGAQAGARGSSAYAPAVVERLADAGLLSGRPGY